MTAVTATGERWILTVSAGRSEHRMSGEFDGFVTAVSALRTYARQRWAEELQCYCGSRTAESCACAGTANVRGFVETLTADVNDYRGKPNTWFLYPDTARYLLPYAIRDTGPGRWIRVSWNLYRID